MSFLNDGRYGNWVCYLHGDASLACCVQLNQWGPEHKSGRLATRGFVTPEEAFVYLYEVLGQPIEKIRYFVASPEQFLLTQVLAGPCLPLPEKQVHKGLSPLSFQPF